MLSKLTLSAAVVSAGKCPFGFDKGLNVELAHPKVLQSSARYPNEIFTCSSTNSGIGIPTTTADFTQDTYKSIVDAVVDLYETVDDTIDFNFNPRAKFAGCIVRAAGHDFMDYRIANDGTTSGGSDGCIDFDDDDNKGLADCLENSGLAAVYDQFCDTVSFADFLVIAGESVTVRTSAAWPTSGDRWAETRGPYVIMNNFKFGRTSAETCDHSAGSLMPNPELGCDGLKDIFVDHIYKAHGDMAWNMTAAISGAHTLGSASIENSGYNGFWDDEDEAGKFNNGYFKSILLKGWYRELAVGGNKNKNQWKRIDEEMNDDHKEMMLSTDMCLAFDANQAAAEANCSENPNRIRC